MKKFIYALMLYSIASTMARAASPNTYTCSGTFEGVNFSLTYSNPNSNPKKSGIEHITLIFNSEPLQQFSLSGDEIKKAKGIFGDVVGIIIETAPGVIESWSMIIPKLSVRSVYNKTRFDTVAIRGMEIDAAGSVPNYRQSDAYLKNLKYLNVSCLATLDVYR